MNGVLGHLMFEMTTAEISAKEFEEHLVCSVTNIIYFLQPNLNLSNLFEGASTPNSQ